MKKTTRNLLIIYCIIVIIKICLAYFILAPSAFSDDYGYAKVARSLFYHGTFTVHDVTSTGLPLYSILLSPSYIFKDMVIVFFLMKILNALMSSLIIIPAWLLSKEFFNEKKAMLLTILIAVLPAHFSFVFFLMPENLFYPLFLFSVYFIYKSFIKESYIYDILAGIFIGLAYLTKIQAIVLPIAVIFIFLIKILRKDYKEVNKKIVMAFSFLLVSFLWIIRNGLIYGFNKNLLLGNYGKVLDLGVNALEENPSLFLLAFSTWVIIYLGYLMVSSGFIFFIANFFSLYRLNDKKVLVLTLLTFASTMLLIFLASRKVKYGIPAYPTILPYLAGNLIGRYVDTVLPLILINGMLGLKYLRNASKNYILPGIILLFSTQLIFFPLFPVNNMSLTWLGVLKYILDFLVYKKTTFNMIFSAWYVPLFIIIFIGITALLFYLKRKLSIKTFLYLFITFFFLVCLLNFVVVYYNSYTFWYKGEQAQLGLWFNKYDPEISTVLFDERDGCKIFKTNQTCIYNPFMGGGSATIMGFWMNDEIRVGSVDNLKDVDYVVSRHKLDLPLLKETKNGIFLYELNRGSGYD